MLAVLIRHGQVRRLVLDSEVQRTEEDKCANDTATWLVTVSLKLPSSKKLRTMFEAADKPVRVQPPELLEILCARADEKKRQVWARLVTSREATRGYDAETRTVVSVDRFLRHIGKLGARDISIDIHFGDSK